MNQRIVPILTQSVDGAYVTAENFVLHSVLAFPIVRFQPELAQGGYASVWASEMDALLGRHVPFAIIAPATDRKESREDWHDRAAWMKAHQKELRLYCRAVVSIEPEAARREDLRKRVAGFERSFGVSQHVANDDQHAKRIAIEMIAKADVISEALRILALRQQFDWS